MINQRKERTLFWREGTGKILSWDYLSRADQEISDEPLTGHIPGETTTIIQSWSGGGGGGTIPFRIRFFLLFPSFF